MLIELARLETIFSKALALSASTERAAFLDQACGSNLELRQRVEKLLASNNSAGSFMAVPDPNRTVASHIPIHEKPGSRIGRYKLLEQIGEGGFGVVFMAEQEQPIRRRVALKVIKLGMDTNQVVARFEAERQALAMMDHPNIAKVFDGGSTDSGRPYFVMELVKGIPITEYCDQQELSTQDRLGLFVDVCKAVQHAHQRGIIHRDIKPSNVLLTLHDDKAVPKVIDFGIAKATQTRLTDKTLFTEFQQLIGTPAYMSPEQAQIIGMDIDTRSDIYSMGVLLYELLTGSTPFDSRQLSSGGLDEMRRIIREVEAPAPSSRLSTLGAEKLSLVAQRRHCEPQRLGRLVQGDLDWIVMRCLEKDRTRRYDTAVGLAEDIQRHLSDQPVQARPPTLAYRTRKFVRRNKIGVLAGTAITAAILLGLALATVGFIQARRQTEIARKEAARSQQTAQFLTDMLQGVGPSVAMGRDTTMLRDILEQTAERIDKDLKNQPEVQIELRHTLADAYHELGLFKQMEKMARETLALVRSTFGEENLAVADTLGQLGDALHHMRDSGEAESVNRQAIAMQRKLRGGDSLQEASARYHLALTLNFQHRNDEAEVESRAGLAMRRKLLGNEHQDVAKSLDGLSYILREQKKFSESEAAAREALAMRQKLLGNEHPDLHRSLLALGDVFKEEGKQAEAADLFQQLLPGLKKTMGANNPLVARSYNKLAEILFELKKPEESAQALQEAIAILKRAMADFPGQRQSFFEPQAHNHRLLAFRYWEQRNYSGAREMLGIASELFRQSAEDEAPTNVATAIQGEAEDFLFIAQLWEAETHTAEADEAYRQALALHERIEREERAQDITTGWIVNHYNQLGQLLEKVATREDVLRIAEILHTPKQGLSTDARSALVNCQFQLATALQKHGSTQEAIQQLQNLRAKLHADDPLSFRTDFSLATILRQTGKLNEASQLCLQAAEQCHLALPAFETLTTDKNRHQDCWSFAIACEQLAQLLKDLGQKKEAEEAYRDAQVIWIKLVADSNIEDDRWHLAVNYDLLGHLLRDSGRLDEAAGSYQMALGTWEKLAPETQNPDHYIHLSLTRSTLADLLRSQGESARAQVLLLDSETACRDALAICQQRPKEIDAWLQNWAFDTLGGVLTALGDTSTLEAAATQSVENLRARPPADEGYLAVALANLANNLRKNGKLADARSLAEEAVSICRRQPNRAELWMQDRTLDALRRVLTQLGDTAACAALSADWINHVEKTGNADQLASAYAEWIPVLMSSELKNDGEEFCRKLLALAHKNDMANNNAAWFLATAENPDCRRPALAVELAKKAVEWNPNAGISWNTRGVAHYRAGDWQSALKALGKSMDLRNGGDAFDWFFVAMTHWKLGDQPEAREWYDKATEWMDKNRPDNEELRRFRAEADELIIELIPATQPSI